MPMPLASTAPLHATDGYGRVPPSASTSMTRVVGLPNGCMLTKTRPVGEIATLPGVFFSWATTSRPLAAGRSGLARGGGRRAGTEVLVDPCCAHTTAESTDAAATDSTDRTDGGKGPARVGSAAAC